MHRYERLHDGAVRLRFGSRGAGAAADVFCHPTLLDVLPTVIIEAMAVSQDIHATLGTPTFWRLRIGVGHPGDRSQVADYVLHPPRAEETRLLDEAIGKALDVAPLILADDLTGAMHKLHTKPKLPPAPDEEKHENEEGKQ